MRLPCTHRQHSLQPPMTPLIDVVFLLLIFFIWNRSIDQPEYNLLTGVLQTPSVVAGVLDNQDDFHSEKFADEVVIEIFLHANLVEYRLNAQPMTGLSDIRGRLNRFLVFETPLILAPEPNVPMGAAVEVFDMAVSSGFLGVTFAAK